MIIGHLGRKGSGKTWCARWLAENYGAEILSFAQPLKAMVAEALELAPSQVYGTLQEKEHRDHRYGLSGRELLQRFGSAARRNLGTDVWVRACLNKVESGKLYVIDDVRYTNESRAIKQLGGRVVKLVCPDVETEQVESEREVDNARHHYSAIISVEKSPGAHKLIHAYKEVVRDWLI